MCTSCPDTSTSGMPITKFEEKGKKKKDSVEMDKKTDHVIGKLQYYYDIKIQSNKNNLKPVQTATKKKVPYYMLHQVKRRTSFTISIVPLDQTLQVP